MAWGNELDEEAEAGEPTVMASQKGAVEAGSRDEEEQEVEMKNKNNNSRSSVSPTSCLTTKKPKRAE